MQKNGAIILLIIGLLGVLMIMNKEWSEMNKKMQKQLNKTTFKEGINLLLELREMLMQEMISWKDELEEKDYYAISFYKCQWIS